MEFVIVTGMSGAGKTRTINSFEDLDYYCVDNIPPKLLHKFVELCKQTDGHIEKVAIVMDSRGGNMFTDFFEGLEELTKNGIEYKLLFLDAGDNVLMRRYKETRRKHPLIDSVSGSIENAITDERKMLKFVREKANYVIDTSLLSPAQLKEKIVEMFMCGDNEGLFINCTSFGFKYGLPADSDLVFDVRCMPNPFYIDGLKHKTGLDKDVEDYVMDHKQATGLIPKVNDMIDYLLPLYIEEGKSQLIISFGCTGGRHRSVVFAQKLNDRLANLGYHCIVTHRDIDK